jgi:hypothetical protein
MADAKPRVRINRQPLEQRSQFRPEAVSTKSGNRMKLVHVVLLRVLSHDRISHESIHPISETPATPNSKSDESGDAGDVPPDEKRAALKIQLVALGTKTQSGK